MSVLGPCPFCGDERTFVEKGVPFDDGICHVECARCGASGPVADAEDLAAEAWNLRCSTNRSDALDRNLAAKVFTREELHALAALSAFESNPAVRLANVAAFALSLLDRAERARSLLASLVQHEEIVGGSLVRLSTSYRLAKAALAALEGEEE